MGEYFAKFTKLFRFCAVGGTAALLDVSTVWVMHHLSSAFVALSCGFLVGITWHFLLNKFWVFRCSRSDYARQLLQYGANVLICYLITIGVATVCLNTFAPKLSALGAEVFGFTLPAVVFAKLCAIPFATGISFANMHFIVFRARSDEKETPEPEYQNQEA
jgi:putative flippase GtrA